ncbi:MAG TPA: hypothetical protein VFZ16_20010 [Hyphomicrobiaceae bacterium]|nr:hypothetical protein [Hyphomicrobiaceae bacterium]
MHKRGLIIIVLLAALSYSSCQLLITWHHLNHIPAALNVQRVLYASEQEWGFGPGGDEAGIIVYQMPDDVASELQKKGLAHLRSLPTGKRQRAIQWLPTPVEIEGVC